MTSLKQQLSEKSKTFQWFVRKYEAGTDIQRLLRNDKLIQVHKAEKAVDEVVEKIRELETWQDANIHRTQWVEKKKVLELLVGSTGEKP